MSIGLPTIEIIFQQLAVSAIDRSGRGIVALVVKDDTDESFQLVEYKNATQIETSKFTPQNVQFIKDCFIGVPSKVMVVRLSTSESDGVAKAIEILGSKRYNWIGFADGTETEHQDLATYVKSQENLGKTIKAVVYQATTTDCMHVVNFMNDEVTYKSTDSAKRGTVSGKLLVARILGLLAGNKMDCSATYKIISELESVSEFSDVEDSINKGGFCLINDDEDVRVGRAVNSLQTTSSTVTEDMKKIVIVESMDIIKDDIVSTFRKQYVGKYKNRYDNQILFISAVKSYFKTLANEEILDSAYENTVDVDVEAQRLAWTSIGKLEADSWDDATVKANTFRSNIYLAGKVKILDAMEDLKFVITML